MCPKFADPYHLVWLTAQCIVNYCVEYQYCYIMTHVWRIMHCGSVVHLLGVLGTTLRLLASCPLRKPCSGEGLKNSIIVTLCCFSVARAQCSASVLLLLQGFHIFFACIISLSNQVYDVVDNESSDSEYNHVDVRREMIMIMSTLCERS